MYTYCFILFTELAAGPIKCTLFYYQYIIREINGVNFPTVYGYGYTAHSKKSL